MSEKISQIIRNRRSVYPASFVDKNIEKEKILEILENANYAPTHRLTQPWRFKIIQDEKLQELGSLLADYYKANTPEEAFKTFKYNKTLNKPSKCACVIAICMQRDKKESVPEWEEIAATAMAVQNMWLTAAEMGIGAYWSSPKAIHDSKIIDFLKLNESESCLGFFYMGYHNVSQFKFERTSMDKKITWL